MVIAIIGALILVGAIFLLVIACHKIEEKESKWEDYHYHLDHPPNYRCVICGKPIRAGEILCVDCKKGDNDE